MSDHGVIRLSRLIHFPSAAVWRALTEPEIHAQWWAAGDVKAKAGHKFTLDMGKFGRQACEVIAVEPEHSFSYKFAPGTLNTIITWRLEPEGEGTRLHLEQAGFDLDSAMGKMAYEGMRAGWPQILERLESVLAK